MLMMDVAVGLLVCCILLMVNAAGADLIGLSVRLLVMVNAVGADLMVNAAGDDGCCCWAVSLLYFADWPRCHA